MPESASTEPSDTPLVSVITATYDGDRLEYLQRSVQSILAQTHRNLELLVILDGPIAAANRHWLDDAASGDARVRIIPLAENQGPAHARNQGITQARGAYIAIADADDESMPNRLERQLAFIGATGADLVGSCYQRINSSGENLGSKSLPLSREAIRSKAILLNPVANSTVLARAHVLKQHPYSEPLRFGEDYTLWVNLLLEGMHIQNQDEELVRFRTDQEFLLRRGGWERFCTEVRVKIHALALHPLWFRPFGMLLALAVAIPRLLPAPCLAVVYRMRNRLRFGP